MSDNSMKVISGDGHLMVGGCDTVDLAAEYGTPLYVFDEGRIRSRCREYLGAFGERYPKVEIA